MTEKFQALSNIFEGEQQQLFNALLVSMNSVEQADYYELLCQCEEFMDAKYKINMGFALKNGAYNIFRDVDEPHDAGAAYINEHYPDLDEIVFSNLDFDGVAMDLDGNGGFHFDDVYITNYFSEPEKVYDASNAEDLILQLEQEQKQTQTPDMQMNM